MSLWGFPWQSLKREALCVACPHFPYLPFSILGCHHNKEQFAFDIRADRWSAQMSSHSSSLSPSFFSSPHGWAVGLFLNFSISLRGVSGLQGRRSRCCLSSQWPSSVWPTVLSWLPSVSCGLPASVYLPSRCFSPGSVLPCFSQASLAQVEPASDFSRDEKFAIIGFTYTLISWLLLFKVIVQFQIRF